MVIALSFSGCRELGSGWSTDTLFPMVDSKLDLADLFKDSLLRTNSDNELVLVYSSKILDFNMDDFAIPDTTVLQNHPGPPITLVLDKRFPLITDTSTNRMDIPNVDLLSTTIKNGKMFFKITSSIREDVEITYTMPGAIKNGVPLQVTRVLVGSPSISNPTVRTETIDLSGYTIDLRGQNKRDYNTMIYFLKVKFVDPINPSTTYSYGSTDFITIENSLQSITPEFGKGVFHTQTISIDTASDETIDLFDNILGGTMDLEKAEMNLSFKNYIGVDFQGKINKLIASNSKTNNKVELKSDLVGKTLNITRAQRDNGNQYPPVKESYYNIGFNESNSNIDKVIENFPDQFEYNIDFEINPNGNTSGGNDFIYTEYGIEGLLNLEMPLSIMANNLMLFDTTDFDPGDAEDDLNSVIGGYLHLYCDNWYPFEAEIQLKLLDRDNNELIELFLPLSKIKAGVTNENGRVTTATRTKISAPADQQRITEFYKAEKAIIFLTFNTDGQKHKKIYSSYFCNIKVIADLQLNLEIK